MGIAYLVIILTYLWRITYEKLQLPTIALQEGDEAYINFEEYFSEPNMNYFVTNSRKICSPKGVSITPSEVMIQRHTVPLTASKRAEVAASSPSLVVKFILGVDIKIYYLAFFNADLTFYLYDISNFNQLDDTKNLDNTVVYMNSLDMRGVWPYRYDYAKCSSLFFEEAKERFYSLCFDLSKNAYIAYVDTKHLKDPEHNDKVVLSTSSSGKLNTRGAVFRSFDMLYDRYLYHPSWQEPQTFCFTDIVDTKPKKSENDYCIKDMMAKLKKSLGLNSEAEDPAFSFSDMIWQDHYLFISDIQYGIFVLDIEDNHGTLRAND